MKFIFSVFLQMYTAIYNSFNDKNALHQIGEYSKIVGASTVNEDVKEALNPVPNCITVKKRFYKRKRNFLN